MDRWMDGLNEWTGRGIGEWMNEINYDYIYR